jgi:2-oxoisovalerate dehydrogenase E1 component
VRHDRVAVVEANLDATLRDLVAPSSLLADDDPVVPGSTLTAAAARDLFADQVRSRVTDVVARELKATGDGYYTISSAGHEDNAVIGTLLRPTDPCFLHYRSGGLVMARMRQLDRDPVWDTLLSLCASADDPASGGRHKVWGSAEAWIPPQTSTIASHLPKAMGAAFAIGRAARLGIDLPIPHDSIVACSFGDASANHATALAGINSARWARRQGAAVPILFVCEDNGLGISVPTPRRWIRNTYTDLPGLRYLFAGGDIDDIWATVEEAVATCRSTRGPVFLHLDTVRLWGHAGSDVELTYRTLDDIEATEARDPIARTARRLVALGAATAEQLTDIVESTRARARELAPRAAATGHLDSVEAITAPLAPHRPDVVRDAVASSAQALDEATRREVFDGTLPEEQTAATRRTLAAQINAALTEELARRPGMLVFGEDVGRKGGVYHVTAGLQQRFGPLRVFDTPLDETTILGVAQGAGLLGMTAVPEIQYLAYLHNALDQIRGEAASTSFFSDGAYRSPMVVRVAGLAYQKGFGGHFHNDNAIGALRDIPGLVIAVPARGDDAVRMLRGCLAMAEEDGQVVVFLEPIALYHEKDLHEPGDGGWLTDHPPPGECLLPGDVEVYGEEHTDVLVVTYANGLRMSLRVAARLAATHGIGVRVMDVRWLNPLPVEAIRHQAASCHHVVVVDECRATGGGIADAVVADLAEHDLAFSVRTVRAADSYVPLGPAADVVLVSESDIEAAIREIAVAHPAEVAPAARPRWWHRRR